MIDTKELRELMKLNQEELFLQAKEYLGVYLLSVISDPKGKNQRKKLLQKLKEYQKIIKEENRYLDYMIKNHKKIRDWEEACQIVKELDILNELTYTHYDNILEQYEETLYNDQITREIIPNKNFETLLERTDYLERILGLTLTEKDLEAYYQSEVAWEYLKGQTKILPGKLEDTKSYFGCYPQIEKNLLMEIKICVPPITNLESMKINVHEYKHGIDLYPYLGKSYPEMDYEQRAREEEENYRMNALIKKKLY